MAKLGKRTRAAREAFADKTNLTVEDAVKLVKSAPWTKVGHAPTAAAWDAAPRVEPTIAVHATVASSAGRKILGMRQI